MSNVIEWRPHSGPQEHFHECPAYEALFGGTKGQGKTECLLRESTRQIDNPNYRAIIFRRTYPRLGEVIDRSHKYFSKMGFVYSGKDNQVNLPAWTAPSGAKICFGHIQHEKDKWNYHGKEFHFIGFDEVAEFTQTQYLFIMAQNRTSDKTIKCYIRSTANPGGVGHAWVKKRFIDACSPGEVHYFKTIEDEDLKCDKTDRLALSRCFIPATVYDNPSITQNDPNYLKRLEQLPEQDKQAFLYGNWDIFKGQFFKMWRKAIHVQEVEIPDYARRFLSLDYGYGAPSSVGWWASWRDGDRVRLHRYRELYREGLTYEKLAHMIMEMTPHAEHLDYCVADPAIWGDKSRHTESLKGESGAETMQNIFGQFTGLVKADNNRITGWGRMRILLEPYKNIKDQLVSDLTYSPKCKDSIRTIPSLIHDEVSVEDLNTEGEDHCFRGDTLVETIAGAVNIQDLVGTEGLIYSLDGNLEFYRSCRLTQKMAKLIKISFEDGREVVCTPNHKFYTTSGWTKGLHLTDELCYNVSTGGIPCELKLLAKRNKAFSEHCITSADNISNAKALDYIEQFGNILMEKFHTVSTFITKITTEVITKLKILRWYVHINILAIMPKSLGMGDGLSASHVSWLQSGTGQKLEESGIQSIFTSTSKDLLTKLFQSCVSNAEKNTPFPSPGSINQNFATKTAKLVRCVSVENWGVDDVYCLTVPTTKSFAIEGGLLVHNCSDDSRYAIMSRPVSGEKPTPKPEGVQPMTAANIERMEEQQAVYDEA